MQKVSAYTSTADSNGEFTNGSVATGVSPTVLEAGFFNGIQRELVGAVEGAGLELDAGNDRQLLAAIKKLISANHGSQRFTISGQFQVPEGITTVWLSGCAGGGGGGGGGTRTTTTEFGGGGAGGGAGQPVIKYPVTVVPGEIISVVIGAGGTAGSTAKAANGTAGTSGGNTSFGSYLTLYGGGGGGGGGGGSTQFGGSPGAGYPLGSSGNDGNGAAGSIGTGHGGAGGSGPFGGGGGCMRSSSGGSAVGNAGLNAYGYGAGGGGGSTGINGVGAQGMPGFLLVEW